MHTNYIIPVNFTDAGKLLGTFPVRNSIEALCLLVPVALICLNLSGLSFTVRLMLTVGTAVIICGVALVGINDFWARLKKFSTCRHRKKEARKGGFLLPISETA